MRPRVPVFQHPEVVDCAVGGRRSILVHAQGQCCTIGGAHGHRKAGVGRDVHIRCVCQCVAGRALPLQKNPVGHDVVVRTGQGQEVGSSHHQHTRGDVVGGAGDGGGHHIAHRNAIAGQVCNHHGRIRACGPVFGGNQVVGGCAGGAGAVLVQDQIGAHPVCGAQCERERRRRGDFDIAGGGQRVRHPPFALQAELVGDDVIRSAKRCAEPGARHHQDARAGVVGCTVNGGCGDVDGQPGRRAADIARSIRGLGCQGMRTWQQGTAGDGPIAAAISRCRPK